MVLGIITAIAACPAIIGTNQAVTQGQHKNAKEKHRGLKTNLIVTCTGSSSGSHEVNGRSVVLLNNKVCRIRVERGSGQWERKRQAKEGN